MKGYKIGFSETGDNGNFRLHYALIELDIPENYPGLKCYSFEEQNRTNVARVLKINKLDIVYDISCEPTVIVTREYLDSAFSLFDPSFCYRPGEIVYPDRFEDRPFICTNGIHFFTYRQQAIDYVMGEWSMYKFTERALEKIIICPITAER